MERNVILAFLKKIVQTTFSGIALCSLAQGSFAKESLPYTPYDLCEGVKNVNNKEAVKMPIISKKPEVGVPYIDPVFGTKIMRISDSAKAHTDVIKPVYSTVQAWNADESLLFLWHRGEGHYLYDGKTYKPIKLLNIVPSDLEEVFWDPIIPHILFVFEYDKIGSKLIKYDVKTDEKTVIKDFVAEGICKTGKIINDANMISLEGRKIGMRCYERDASTMMVYSIDEDTFSPIKTNKELGVHGYTALYTSLSGKTYFANEKIFDTNLKFQYRLNVAGGEHSTLGQFADRSDGFFAVAFDPAPEDCENGPGIGMLITHDFKTRQCHEIFGKGTGFPYPPGSVHLSPLSFHNPGWVAISAVGYETTLPLGEDQPLFHQEIIVSNSDHKNHRYCRVGHNRSWGKYGKVGYFAEPHVTLSRDGRRMLFASDWHDSGAVDTYVIELPVYLKGK